MGIVLTLRVILQGGEVVLFREAIGSPRCVDLPLAPSTGPYHTILIDPVMRLTPKRPIPNRGIQRYALTVVRNSPVCWRDGRNDFHRAAAATQVCRGCVRNRHVERPFIE